MGYRNLNFSNQPIGNLNLGIFDKSMNVGTYSYFKAEYYHALPYDIEREMIHECVQPGRLSNFIMRMKEKIFKSSFVLVPLNSPAHAYFETEFRGNIMPTDNQKNIIVPDSFYSKKRLESKRCFSTHLLLFISLIYITLTWYELKCKSILKKSHFYGIMCSLRGSSSTKVN